MLHLHTPITARLRDGSDILDVLAALHPTPAVGGVPTAAASRWLEANEGEPRGWYAAPVGWLDPVGDGHFVVALRSALVRGTEAHCYAGAGIVDGSDPESEYAETELKARTLMTALGVPEIGTPTLEVA